MGFSLISMASYFGRQIHIGGVNIQPAKNSPILIDLLNGQITIIKARRYRDFLVFPPILIPATTDQLSKNRRPRTYSF